MSARLGVLVSGGGRSLENLAEVVAAGELDVELALVVSSSAQAFALERAKRLGIECVTVQPLSRRPLSSTAACTRSP